MLGRASRTSGLPVAPGRPGGPIPVLFLITNFDRGGAEKALVRCANGLPRDRYGVHVAALQALSGAILEDLALPGARAHDLGMASKADVRVALRLLRLLRQERIQILITYLFHPTILGRLIGWAADVPLRISSERIMAWDGVARRLLNRWTAPLATHVVAVSDRVAAYAAQEYRISTHRLSTIPNGVDLNHFLPSLRGAGSRTAVTLGCTGRLHAKNDHLMLLQAFARIRGRWPGADLLLVGRGPEGERLKTATTALGLAPCTRFVGEQPDVAPWLQQMDIYVQTSVAEGMSKSVLEAMAAGLPVVATAVGGTPEVVVDGETGLLVPARDPAAMAEAVGRLIENAALRDAFGRAGRRRVEECFGEDLMVRQMTALLDRLVAEHLGLCYQEQHGWVRGSPCPSS